MTSPHQRVGWFELFYDLVIVAAVSYTGHTFAARSLVGAGPVDRGLDAHHVRPVAPDDARQQPRADGQRRATDARAPPDARARHRGARHGRRRGAVERDRVRRARGGLRGRVRDLRHAQARRPCDPAPRPRACLVLRGRRRASSPSDSCSPTRRVDGDRRPDVDHHAWAWRRPPSRSSSWSGGCSALLDAEHLGERLGQLVIIVLGEAFVGLVSTLGGRSSIPNPVYFVLTFLVVFAIWTLYFSSVMPAGVPRQSRSAAGVAAHARLLMFGAIGAAAVFSSLTLVGVRRRGQGRPPRPRSGRPFRCSSSSSRSPR